MARQVPDAPVDSRVVRLADYHAAAYSMRADDSDRQMAANLITECEGAGLLVLDPSSGDLCSAPHPGTGATCEVPASEVHLHHPMHGHYSRHVGAWPVAGTGQSDSRDMKLRALFASGEGAASFDPAGYAAFVLRSSERAGLLVVDPSSPELDPSSPELVERIAEVFWLRLQDYMPGMDREDWDYFIKCLSPTLLAALAGNEPGGKT